MNPKDKGFFLRTTLHIRKIFILKHKPPLKSPFISLYNVM